MAREKAAVAEKTAAAPQTTEVIPDARAVVAVPAAAGPPAAAPAARRAAPGNLCAALAAAQQKCKPVRKDAINTFHRYRYASAEAVIAEAKAALSDTGLALVPVEQALNRTPNGGYELVRKFVLLHESGESIPLCCAWPVVEEKGRPVDKATAISATASLAYILRDLLLMPRINADDDLAARRDRPIARPATAPPNGMPATPQPTATVMVAGQHVAGPAPTAPPPVSPPAPESTAAPSPQGSVTPTVRGEQLDLIDTLAEEAGCGPDLLAKRLVRSFGFGDPKQLSAEQAERVIASLEATKAAREKESAATAESKS